MGLEETTEAAVQNTFENLSMLSTTSQMGEPLVKLSVGTLFISMIPLVIIALISRSTGLELEIPIFVGIVRTFVQLSILGLILEPIFVLGLERWWLIMLYVCFMVLLASLDAASRSKYSFKGQRSLTLVGMMLNMVIVSVFSFGFLIRSNPWWDPQYVIPIVGMLLGNMINSVSLSMSAMLTSLVEQQREIELLLSFGATSFEASSRLIREAVRTGAMPILNSMCAIGLISIPGMMTGQILGGTSVMDAAQYQMLIMYLIVMCSFGTILSVVWITQRTGFDSFHMLRVDRFTKRDKNQQFIMRMSKAIGRCCCPKEETLVGRETERKNLLDSDTDSQKSAYTSPKGSIEVTIMRQSSLNNASGDSVPSLQVRNMKRTVPSSNPLQNAASNDSTGIDISETSRRLLFQNFNLSISAGTIARIGGPSGVGKSQLLRGIAGLSPIDEGDVILRGMPLSTFIDMTAWREEIRYVTQYKIDLPGTPNDFLYRLSSLQVFKKANAPTLEELTLTTCNLLQSWGLDQSHLDTEWSMLSGGEGQRAILAVALASRPKILLLDESTSGLDLDAKLQVEKSVELVAANSGASVLWITHDRDQIERLGPS
mmetsp:Transcript_22975/g.32154  ORF Transcript_22975/g.32154 Transcript_22975/m.32154 type:complete len:599 (-) Transcript_22975:51-1847(-)